MRHAKSSWNQTVSDRELDLNTSGKTLVGMMSKWLHSLDYIPDEAVASTGLRTRKTY